MTHLLDIATNICIGLLVGAELTVAVFINPILWKLDSVAQMSAIRMFARRLSTAMPFWYAASLLLLIAEAVVRRHESGFRLLVIAGGIWALVIVLTLLFLLPINNRLARSEALSMSAAAGRVHRKWDTLHRWRVAALATSMICFLLAISI